MALISRMAVRGALQALPGPLQATLRLCTVRPLRAYTRFAPWTIGKMALYDTLASHLWWLESTVNARTHFGATLEVDASDIVGKHIYYFGVWEPVLSRWMVARLKPGDTFIDVGANIGYFSVLAAKLVGARGTVVSIEAEPHIHAVLDRNLRRNAVGPVRSVRAAAWDRTEVLPLFARPGRPAGTTTLVGEWASHWQLVRGQEVEAKPLSAILRREEICTARMMKIDVEGAEFRVLSEMTSWLDETRNDFEVVVEVARSIVQAHGGRFEDLLMLYRRFGFCAYRMENDYRTASCIHRHASRSPRRIERWPDEHVEQIDVVFSRRDSEAL